MADKDTVSVTGMEIFLLKVMQLMEAAEKEMVTIQGWGRRPEGLKDNKWEIMMRWENEEVHKSREKWECVEVNITLIQN